MLNSTLKKIDESNAFFVILKKYQFHKTFYYCNGTASFFYYFINYRGHHRKGTAIDTVTEVNLHFHKLLFQSTKMYLNTIERF
jgi:hypothetical protein